MTHQEMIDKAKAEAMSRVGGGWTPALEDAINTGLCHGDRIGLGGGAIAEIKGDMVEITKDGAVIGGGPLVQLTGDQRDQLLIRKGVQAGRWTQSMGGAKN
jgi:hypothetical protein